MTRRPLLLMCPPTFYDVDYVINPWMDGNVHKASKELAQQQWKRLHTELARHAEIKLLEPRPGLPDMVFTANAGLVWGGRAYVSSFRCVERQGEEWAFAEWFQAAGMKTLRARRETPFEGEGDALWSTDGTRLWGGYGLRSSVEGYVKLREWWSAPVVTLKLVDPRFYHLDTCFAPLPNGDVLYFPAAFDAASRKEIEAFYPEPRRIAVGEEDALSFCCNVVALGETLVLNHVSGGLRAMLEARGFRVIEVGLSEFLRAGGAAKCLVLHLDLGPGRAA